MIRSEKSATLLVWGLCWGKTVAGRSCRSCCCNWACGKCCRCKCNKPANWNWHCAWMYSLSHAWPYQAMELQYSNFKLCFRNWFGKMMMMRMRMRMMMIMMMILILMRDLKTVTTSNSQSWKTRGQSWLQRFIYLVHWHLNLSSLTYGLMSDNKRDQFNWW